MQTIKRILSVSPSTKQGHIVCEIRYPSGRAETVEINKTEYQIHRIKESLDDAGVNMKVIRELEDLLISQGFDQAIEKWKKEKPKCRKNILSPNFWKWNSQASSA